MSKLVEINKVLEIINYYKDKYLQEEMNLSYDEERIAYCISCDIQRAVRELEDKQNEIDNK